MIKTSKILGFVFFSGDALYIHIYVCHVCADVSVTFTIGSSSKLYIFWSVWQTCYLSLYICICIYLYMLTCYVRFRCILFFRVVSGVIVNNKQGSYSLEVQIWIQTLYGCILLVSSNKKRSNSCVVCSITVVICSSSPFFGCQYRECHRENITYGAGHAETIGPAECTRSQESCPGWLKKPK